MNDAVIARSALRFLRVEAERRGLAEELRSSGLENRERIASLLDHAGILAVAEEA